ncbi:MAG: hypothetical protein WCX27_02730 [Candidatus Paceibacterota bacterium]|jgi:hypothetical protein
MKKLLFYLMVILAQLSVPAQAVEVDWNGGGSLPKPTPQTEPGNQSGSWPVYPKPGTYYTGHPHVIWLENGDVGPEEGYQWSNQNNFGEDDFVAVPIPFGTPHKRYPNVIWIGDGVHFRPIDGYDWENLFYPEANNFRVRRYAEGEKQVLLTLPNSLKSFKDKKIRAWVGKIGFKFRKDYGMMSPWASGSNLVFTKDFLEETPSLQENLLAFEAGKVFLTCMGKETVKGGETLESWFRHYSDKYGSVIQIMKNTKHGTESLDMISDPTFELTSAFGYAFRTQALRLEKPKDKKEQEKWKEAVREFRDNVNPILKNSGRD